MKIFQYSRRSTNINTCKMRVGVLSLLILLAQHYSFCQNNFNYSVLFRLNTSIIDKFENLKLNKFIKSLDKKEEVEISIIGYSDDLGDEKLNRNLSLKRAESIRNKLVFSGIKANNINLVVGKGELEILTSETKTIIQQRKRNRRVDILVKYVSEEEEKLLSDKLNVGDKINLRSILFVGGKTKLQENSYSTLDSLTKFLKTNRGYHIVIIGHIYRPANSTAEEMHQDGTDVETGLNNLSVARAKCIYDYLIKKGISSNRLEYVGLKGNYPSGKGDASDRRVEIQIKKISIQDKYNLLEQLIERAKKENQLDENKINWALVKQLDLLLNKDQEPRIQLENIVNRFGVNSREALLQWQLINKQDSLNVLEIESILLKNGWLGFDVVGYKGNATIFLVIQHSPLRVQVKYLPILREAVKNKNARPQDLALFEDRIALSQGKKQIYGSQIIQDDKTGSYFLAPMIDPDNVDKRRATMGLNPISNYVANWGIVWDVIKYKKELFFYEKRINSFHK